MRNLTRKVHAKFGEASSIRSGGKVGGTKSRNKKKKERKKEDTFLARKRPISNSHKIQTISNFDMR